MMTAEQTGQVLGIVRALWPHSDLGEPVQAQRVWHSLLGEFAPDQVAAALKELAAGGREHAPPPGTVLQAITDRATDLPEWDEAYREILAAIRRYGSWQTPPAEHWSCALLARFMEGVWLEWCQSPAPGTSQHGTFAAQQREAFKAMRARVQRDTGLVAIAAPRRSSLTRLSPLEAAGITPPAGALEESTSAC